MTPINGALPLSNGSRASLTKVNVAIENIVAELQKLPISKIIVTTWEQVV